jgi:hypothetical protein
MALRYSNGRLTNSSIAYEERVLRWRVEDLTQFRRNHRKFLLSWTNGERWMLPAYLDLGARAEVLNAGGAGNLFLVTDDHPAGTQAGKN